MRERTGLLAITLAATLVRAPFVREALGASVDGDTAIVGLMARHLGEGTTLWGQPYGSPLDAWVAAPFVALLGPTRLALRLPYLLLSLALVPLAYFLARALDARAGLLAACLAAFPPAYVLVLSALPPPLYPTTLVLLGVVLLLTLRLGAAAASGRPSWPGLAIWGASAGLALWTHLMSATVVVAGAAYLAAKWRRRPAVLAVALGALVLFAAPWWLRLPSDPSALWAVGVSREGETLLARLGRVLPAMHRPLLVIIGARVPLTVDDADHVLAPPAWATGLLVAFYAVGLAGTARLVRRRGEAGLLAAVVLLVLLVFPFPVRAGPDTPRFLTPLLLPLVALLATAALAAGRPRRAWAFVLGLAAGHLLLSARLLDAWRATAPEALVPDCVGVRRVLEGLGITRAYASYNPAYCLTYESGETIVASQPWNERFFGYPLPFLDEVRFARNAAWVLMPGMDFDIPSPRRFEGRLRAAGGAWRRTEAGAAMVYHSFVPPFPPTVVPLATAGPAGDGSLDTRLTHPPRGPVTFVLPAPTPLAAVTIIAGKGDLGLPRNFTVEFSADGVAFERLARLRPGWELTDLGWVNGHPQFIIDGDLLALSLGGRTVAAVRVTPAGAEDWATEEVLLHPPGRLAPWDEWLDPALPWAARKRALEANPRPDRQDWYYRSLLAARQR